MIVLTCKESVEVAERCFESLRCLPADKVNFIIGMDVPSIQLKRLVQKYSLIFNPIIFESPQHNLFKTRMMLKLLPYVKTKYLWWFDDDSYIRSVNAYYERFNLLESDSSISVIGKILQRRARRLSLLRYKDISQILSSALWNKNEYVVKPDEHISFPQGANWFANSTILNRGWPDARFPMGNEDVIMGLFLTANNLKMAHLNSDELIVKHANSRWWKNKGDVLDKIRASI